MNRDRMRTVVAIVVIAAMVLLAAGALGAALLGGAGDRSDTEQADATGAGDGLAVAVVETDHVTAVAPRGLGT